MSATNDTPLKRFMAFWVVLGAILLFGIITLALAPLSNTSEVTAADEAGATRRLAIREIVDAEQLKNLSRSEVGTKLQVPPAEVFSLVGAKIAAAKPMAMKDERFRDPNIAGDENAAAGEPAPATPEETANEVVPKPAAKPAPAPAAKPAPAPAAKPAPVPAAKPAPVPAAKPAPAPAAKPAPVPAAKPAPVPAAKPAPVPAAKPAPVPAAKPAPADVKSPSSNPQAPRPETIFSPAY